MNADLGKPAAIKDYDDVVKSLAPASRRAAEPDQGALPAGTIIVSADNHWTCAEDIFFEGFPEHLKDRAPRWHKEGTWGYWTVGGKPLLPLGRTAALQDFESVPGSSQMAPRLVDLDAEGIHKEIVFPNTVQAFYTFPDLEAREWIFRLYNRYLARLQAEAPGRFYGVGLANYWDMTKARESIMECKDLGLKTVFLPQYPKDGKGVEIDYCSEELEPLWEALDEAGLPIMFHVGEFAKGGRGGMAIGAMVGFGPFRKTFGELVFGGIFDRHPSLQVVFTEADINWVPGALQTATMIYETYEEFLDPKIKHHPRHYWHNNCYATFIYDPLGMDMLDIVGADRVMWSSDYVHHESSFGFGWRAKKYVLDKVSEDQARAILGGTAMKLFKLD